jgi:hypothetical protein
MCLPLAAAPLMLCWSNGVLIWMAQLLFEALWARLHCIDLIWIWL